MTDAARERRAANSERGERECEGGEGKEKQEGRTAARGLEQKKRNGTHPYIYIYRYTHMHAGTRAKEVTESTRVRETKDAKQSRQTMKNATHTRKTKGNNESNTKDAEKESNRVGGGGVGANVGKRRCVHRERERERLSGNAQHEQQTR